MKCPVCKTNDALIKPPLGALPCQDCQDRQSKLKRPSRGVEFTTEDIKRQRKEMGADTWGFHRKGELSKEWVKKYGAEAAKKRGFSEKEIKNAKNVWAGDETYYKEDN